MKIRQNQIFNPQNVRALHHEIMEDLEILRGRPILMKRTRINRQPVKYFKDKKTKQTKLKTADQGGAQADNRNSSTDQNRSNDDVTDNLPDFEKKLWTKILKC